MRKVIVIYLDRNDLIPRCIKDIWDIEICDFTKECFDAYYSADLVVFVDDCESYKILKNREG